MMLKTLFYKRTRKAALAPTTMRFRASALWLAILKSGSLSGSLPAVCASVTEGPSAMLKLLLRFSPK
jgi:hypothetical protein